MLHGIRSSLPAISLLMPLRKAADMKGRDASCLSSLDAPLASSSGDMSVIASSGVMSMAVSSDDMPVTLNEYMPVRLES